MALNTSYPYTTCVICDFYTEDGISLRCNDCGSLDDIHGKICEILIKHNFDYVDVCSADTGEVLMIVQRT